MNVLQETGMLHIMASGFLLLLCSFFNKSVIVDWIAMVVFLQFYISVLIQNANIVWKYIFIHYYIVTAVLSVFLCDTISFYLYEIDSTTHFNGAFPLVVLYYWIIISVLLFIDKKIARRYIGDNRKLKVFGLSQVERTIIKYACPLVFIIGFFMFAMVASKPAFLVNVDRFIYAQKYLPSILSRFQMFPIMILPIVVISINKRSCSLRRKMSICFITFLPYFLFAIWIGQRFQMFFMVIWSLFPMILINLQSQRRKKTIRQQIGIVAVVIVFLFGLISLFSYQRGIPISELLFGRLSEQGQLWWAIYGKEKMEGFPVRLSEFSKEFIALLHSIVDRGQSKNYGIYTLMYLTTPSRIVVGKLQTGSRYAAQGFELAFYYSKYFGFVCAPVFAAFIFSILSNKYYYAVTKERAVRAIIYLRILQKSQTAYTQGDWHALLSPSSLVCYAILLLIFIGENRYKYSRYM